MALIRQDLEAESFFMEAVRIARQGSDANVLGLALTGLGRSLVLRGDADGALEHLEEALTLASRASPRWALVGNALASVRLLLDDASGAHALWAEVADAAEKNADRSTLGQALTGQGLAEIAEGAERLANTSFERSEAALRPTRDRESLLALLIWQGNLSLLAGRYRETMDRMWEAEQLAKAAALQAELARVRGIRAEALLRIGQSEEAATLARQALDALDAALPIEIDAMDDDLTDAEARRRSRERLSCHHLARVLVELEASTRVLRAFPEPDGSEAPDFERTVLLSMAVRARALGPSDPAAAAGMARSVLAFSGSILPFLMARAEIDTALALRSIGQDEPSLQAASRAMARLQTGTWSGLKLEAAIARHRCGGGAGQRSRLLRIVDEVRQLLPLDDQVTFLQRPEIRELMG
jgi:tetratricopeptide (TPR) repeat protein